MTSVYPGTFDPLTLGHYDIIERVADICEDVIVAVSDNKKKKPMFTLEDRVTMVQESTAHMKNVRVMPFDCLLIDFMKQNKARLIIRGLRAVSDFEFEFQLALMNRQMLPQCETLFLMPNQQHIFLSSTIIREVASHGGDVRSFVPEPVYRLMKNQLNIP